jgi:hypothetical protein
MLGRMPRHGERDLFKRKVVRMMLMAERTREHCKKAKYAKVIECVEGHYEAEKVPFGTVYRWCQECVVAECGCGERVILAGSMTTCAGCGTDHATVVQEWLAAKQRAEEDEALHPWRHAKDCEGESLPY